MTHDRKQQDHGTHPTLIEAKLRGLRVLVLEDSFLLAHSLCRMLEDAGCAVVGPVGSVSQALTLINAGECDAGVLDINLGDQTSESVAFTLRERRLPFVFVTGYSSPALLDPTLSSIHKLRKPVSEFSLRTALTRLVQE